ncbi:MAG: methylenetetrahydrofolate reductase [Firmicutes bacterium]|nr:methylenetetrahydrofolate reductase [Bacillota bacterium]
MTKSLREFLTEGKFVLTVEMEPPAGADPSRVLEEIGKLKEDFVAVNIADSPMASLRMSPIALAHLIQEKWGLEVIFHLTCRDRNLLGLQAELLGAAALGVKNILALTGDPPEGGDHPNSTGVFDVDSTGLIKMARSLNQGRAVSGKELTAPTDFLIGTVANPTASDLAREVARLERKIEAGADFVQTQPIFAIEQVERFEQATAHLQVPILYGILPLKNYRSAKYLAEKVPGINIPDQVVRRVEKEGAEAGLALARELLLHLRSRAKGAHIFPMGRPDLALKLVN